MGQDTDTFKDYVYRGLDAMLKFSAKAGDTLRVASNNAIEKIDAFQLERKREMLYSHLGKTAHAMLVSGEPVVGGDYRISGTIEEISEISAELERRFGVSGKR